MTEIHRRNFLRSWSLKFQIPKLFYLVVCVEKGLYLPVVFGLCAHLEHHICHLRGFKVCPYYFQCLELCRRIFFLEKQNYQREVLEDYFTFMKNNHNWSYNFFNLFLNKFVSFRIDWMVPTPYFDKTEEKNSFFNQIECFN